MLGGEKLCILVFSGYLGCPLSSFNIDSMDEAVDSINHRITYISLREIKVLVKPGEIHDAPTIKEEEEDPEEVDETKIEKVLKIC